MHFCQFKERHLSEGGEGGGACVHLHMFVSMYVIRGARGDDGALVAPGGVTSDPPL